MEKIFEKTAKKAEELTKLLDQLINCKPNRDGKTALHLASEKGNLMMVKFLINGGAQIEAKDSKHGQTPLYFADSSEVAKYLIDSGSEIESKNNNGHTPLICAVRFGEIETVKCLIENGAEIEAKDEFGLTSILVAASSGNIEIVKYLIENGADIEAKVPGSGRTSVHVAAKNGHLEIIKYLKEKGAQLEALDNDGDTPLHDCFNLVDNPSKQLQDTIKYLIQNVTHLDIKNKKGDTVLHWAVLRERLDEVKCLIEHGASIDIRDSYGLTPLDIANMKENKDMTKLLMEKKRDTENKNPPKIISDKALCIICFEPRNGLHVLLPCGHTSLCELCCFNLKNEKYSKCPSCRKPVKDYQKIFFQEPETEITKNSNQ